MRGPTKHSVIYELREAPREGLAPSLVALMGALLFVLFVGALLPLNTAGASQTVQCPSSQCLECAQDEAYEDATGLFNIRCIKCRPVKNCSPAMTKSEGHSATTNNPAVQAFGKKRQKLIRVKPTGG